MSKITLYKKARTGKTQQWISWVEPNGSSGYPEINIQFGQVGGKQQLTIDIIKEGVNQGKINETSALEQAGLILDRRVIKQIEEGYRYSKEEANIKQGLDFNTVLQKALTFYKPKSSISDKKLAQLEKNGNAVLTEKRDGFAHIIRKTKKFGVEIYSRRMDLVSDRYPHLLKAFEGLNDDTILLGEIILLEDGKDNFNSVSQICRSDTEKAIQRQEELGKVSYYIYDVAFLNGNNCMTSIKCKDRQNKIKELAKLCNSEYVIPIQIINKTHKDAMKEVKKRGLEGLVIWDKEGMMQENECFTNNGKSYRPNMLWKSKPRYEDDFIARFDPDNEIGEYGSGKNNGKLKSVFLYQIDDNGNEVYISKCGGGFSDEQRTFFTNAKYPKVFRVLFDSIQKDGSLRFPVFDIERSDKLVSECLVNDKIKKAMNI